MAVEHENDERSLTRKDVVFRPHYKARRYIARVNAKGEIVLTIPRGGTQREALSFANEHATWLWQERAKALRKAGQRAVLAIGDRIMVRGVEVELRAGKDAGRPFVQAGEEVIYIANEGMNLMRPLTEHFRGLAKVELPVRTSEIAEQLGKAYKRVVVRDQKTRWGSCSSSREISLNWRLVLATYGARDYVIIHELMHLEEMNHSLAFWKSVKAACPRYGVFERWLDANQGKVNWK